MVSPPDANPGAPGPGDRGPGRASSLLTSFRYAFAGLGYVVRTQRNFRIQLAAGGLAVILAAWLHFSPLEGAVLAGTITLVLTLEMVNTVVEAAVDLASPTYHPLAKIAKDVAAGAVLLTALGALGVGACLFLPHLGR
ncbi:MAG TPA: diacylglycerol kinase family protein [Chloroflexia bacterium]|nr:diacylglycerol kinase family protein [Chloroflexia bacterium]